MLNQAKVVRALEEKQSAFRHYWDAVQGRQHAMGNWLDAFFAMDRSVVEAQLANERWPGARPTEELDRADRLCLPFPHKWANHGEARAWALDTLQERTTVAVDGSQITPSTDIALPVGAIQIGWFINHHRSGGDYVKDLDFEVLGPDDLGGGVEAADAEDSPARDSAPEFATETVNQVRFVRECEKLSALMAQLRAASPGGNGRQPLCFFDGSLIISFAGQIRAGRARQYLTAVESLLAASEEYRVPLVAFVDNPRSRDFVTMVGRLAQRNEPPPVSDSSVIARLLPNWGDRTPLFICAREDGLSADREPEHFFYGQVLFTYLRLGQDGAMARVEMPRWVYDAGLADDVLDLVRAESVVGTGYPYAIETADALAVISQQDRRRFYGLLQQFAQRHDLPFPWPRKARSKERRR